MNKLVRNAKLLAEKTNYDYSDSYINSDKCIYISYGTRKNPSVMTDNCFPDFSIYLGIFNEYRVYCGKNNSESQVLELKNALENANLKIMQDEANAESGIDEWAELELEGVFDEYTPQHKHTNKTGIIDGLEYKEEENE